MNIKNGVITGIDWRNKKTVHIPLSAVRLIVEDAGNQPAADRVYYLDGNLGYVDLKRDKA